MLRFRRIIPPTMKSLTVFLSCLAICAFLSCTSETVLAQQTVPQKERLLWQKLETAVHEADRNLDGVMGVVILDLTTGNTITLNADEVFPTASSIKIAILAELYHQVQQGKLSLSDAYVLQSTDLVGGSGIAGSLTPGVTRLTLRDVAALMISVSDNSMTNVIINRIGMENVNSLLDSLGLTHTRLRRKMMDLEAAKRGRENISTPREMMTLLAAIYRGKVLDKDSTRNFFDMLSTNKDSWIPRDLPAGLKIANKPGALEAVRNDSGIVFVEGRPYVICVMTAFLRNERDGEAAISKISLEAWKLFDRLSRASEYGRVVSPGNGAR